MKKIVFFVTMLIFSRLLQAQNATLACNNPRGKRVACNDTSIKTQPPYIFITKMKDGEVIKSHEATNIDDRTLLLVVYTKLGNYISRSEIIKDKYQIESVQYINH